jgi:hypothetical protein
VRLAGLAYDAWAELEWEAEERLLVTTGGLDLFPAGSAIPPGPYRASLEACGVPYQWLDAAEVMRRWPAFRFYGFPLWPDAALKAAQDVGGHQVTATSRGFDPDPAAAQRLAGFLRARLPTAAGAHDHSATCLYTLTPDRDLVLGPCPATTASWSPSAPPTASSSPPGRPGPRRPGPPRRHRRRPRPLRPGPSRPHQPPGRGQIPGLSGHGR